MAPWRYFYLRKMTPYTLEISKLPFSLSFTHSFFFLHTRAALTWARATGAWGGGRQADGGQCWLSARGNEYSARVYSRPGPVYLPASYIKRV